MLTGGAAHENGAAADEAEKWIHGVRQCRNRCRPAYQNT